MQHKTQRKFQCALFTFLCSTIPGMTFADSCDSLLTVGLYNVSQSSSANEAQSLAKSTFCEADYSKITTSVQVKASIKAAYGLFSGNGSTDVTTAKIVELQRSVCTSGFNATAYKSQASSYSATIYQGALDAWNQCNSLSLKGVKFELQTDNTLQGLTVGLTASLGTTSKFIGLTQTGFGTSVCKTTTPIGTVITLQENTVFPISSTNKLTLICKRNLRRDANGNLFADAQGLVFNTSTGAYLVPLSDIGFLARASVNQASAQIRAAVNTDTRATITQLKTDNLAAFNQFKTDSKAAFDLHKSDTQTAINGITTTVNGIATTVSNINPRVSYQSKLFDLNLSGTCNSYSEVVLNDTKNNFCFVSKSANFFDDVHIKGTNWVSSGHPYRDSDGNCTGQTTEVSCITVLK